MTEPMPSTPSLRFAYEAQTSLGRSVEGSIVAPSLEIARQDLLQMQMLIISLKPQDAHTARPLSPDDFAAFNQQLAHLTAAGLPVEQGLRLIGNDVTSPRLAGAIREILRDLNAGQTLPEALARHEREFPPTYSRLVDAGIRMNNLPAMLFNMSRNIELMKRMRGAVWRAVAYPLMVSIGLLLVLMMLSYKILPQFEAIFQDFHSTLPGLTVFVLDAGRIFPPIGGVLLLILIGWPLVWGLLCLLKLDQRISDALLLWLPLIGPVLRRNLAARWCDTMRLSIEAGLDLPRALQIAADAIGSPAVRVDTERILKLINAGTPLDQFTGGRVLPHTIGAVLHLAAQQQDLATALGSLAAMYQEQADQRVTLLPAILSPILIAMMALSLGTVIIALFLPLVRLIQGLSSW